MSRRAVRAIAVALLAAGCTEPADTSWHQEQGHRWRALDVPRRGEAGFDELDAGRTGLAHRNDVSD